MKKDITKLYFLVDNFYQAYIVSTREKTLKPQNPTHIPGLSNSEVMTIILLFHDSPCKNFKYFYQSYAQQYLAEFHKLPSYNRFLELKKRTLQYFYQFFLFLSSLSEKTGLYYIDSTKIPVCHVKRIYKHKVFKDFASVGKSSMSWFYGFKFALCVDVEIYSLATYCAFACV